jgi:hypothetical protein
MRIVQWSGPPAALILVRTPRDVTVAIPRHSPRHELLELARLTLTTSEYREFQDAITPTIDTFQAVKAPVAGHGHRPALSRHHKPPRRAT